MGPGVALGRRLREHGETAYATSTLISPKTKKGTSHRMSAARRVFDPFRPTYLRKRTAVAPTAAPARPARQTKQQRDAEFVRRAMRGAVAGSVSPADVEFVWRVYGGW